MSALALGVVAAFAWGVHDLLVRRASRRAHIPSCLLVVLLAGAVAQVPLAFPARGDAGALLAPDALVTLLVTGAAFVLASYAMYRAFEIGPVRVVAPAIGAYPIATTLFASAGGASVGASRWVAVLVVVASIALVASGTRGTRDAPFPLARTLLWSSLSAIGFAATFALGQGLSARFDSALVSLATRLAAALVLGVGVALVSGWRRPASRDLPVLGLMGGLDALALGVVLHAGGLPDAVLASVAASLFGVVTIVLARVFLSESMSGRQWVGVGVAFTAIGWLSVA